MRRFCNGDEVNEKDLTDLKETLSDDVFKSDLEKGDSLTSFRNMMRDDLEGKLGIDT